MDMPRVIHAIRLPNMGLVDGIDTFTAIAGKGSSPANPEFFTGYTRTDLVDELIEAYEYFELVSSAEISRIEDALKALKDGAE